MLEAIRTFFGRLRVNMVSAGLLYKRTLCGGAVTATLFF
jgi:hypothetical protein